MNAPAVKDDPTSLGNILTSTGFCTEADLDRALCVMDQNPGMRLGDALVACGVLPRSALDSMMLHQNAVRSRDTKDVKRFARAAVQQTLQFASCLEGLVLLTEQITARLK